MTRDNGPALPLANCMSPTNGRGELSDCLPQLSRREFLVFQSAALVSLSIAGIGTLSAQQASFPKQRITQLSELKRADRINFRYPWDHENCSATLLKLGKEAGGGIGPMKDIVAFNRLCPHMGWEIASERFSHEPPIAGPCAGHLTTFDLTRHGMVISGHATQGLPQVMLELDGDDIIAVGMLGLIFGFANNQHKPVR